MINLRIGILFVGLSLVMSGNTYAADRIFQGKVIDADTLRPIHGAVVVAKWMKTRSTPAGADTVFKDAKETLTDKNGNWSIRGPEGYEVNIIPGFLSLVGVYATESPEFAIYKPGYGKYASAGSFVAYPCVSKEHDLEGIVLIRVGNTREQRKEFRKKYRSRNALPLIRVKRPERKLRDLDFSFEYPEIVSRVSEDWCWRNRISRFWVYTVVGLRKAETRKDRLEAMRFSVGEKALPILEKMRREERDRLLGPARTQGK